MFLNVKVTAGTWFPTSSLTSPDTRPVPLACTPAPPPAPAAAPPCCAALAVTPVIMAGAHASSATAQTPVRNLKVFTSNPPKGTPQRHPLWRTASHLGNTRLI